MRWPPFPHVVFDCDSTLTAIEGIDVLAERAGKGDEVARLTAAAMDGVIDLEDVYGRRLTAIAPTRADVAAVRHDYKAAVVPDAAAVVRILRELGHEVYIVSGGLVEPVREFGISLGVEPANIRAVGLDYDELVGRWWDRHDEGRDRYRDYSRGALAVSEGKAEIIGEMIDERPGRRLMVGDGVSDLLAAEAVDLFVGYGGVAVRPKVRSAAPIFLEAPPLSPILPLAAGPAARRRLRGEDAELVVAGVTGARGAVWNDSGLREAFRAAAAAADIV